MKKYNGKNLNVRSNRISVPVVNSNHVGKRKGKKKQEEQMYYLLQSVRRSKNRKWWQTRQKLKARITVTTIKFCWQSEKYVYFFSTEFEHSFSLQQIL